MTELIKQIHHRAVLAVQCLKRGEKEVIDALMEVDTHRVFREVGYSTLHDYCVMELKLSHDQAYTYIGISRKSREVPELRTLLNKGEIHLTNARTIVPVLTQQNKADLLEKAKALSCRALQRELVRSYPEKVTKERIRPVTETRLEMKLFITPELEKNLKRMQDVLSSKRKKPSSLEETLDFMAEECLERHDPIKRAERAKTKTLVARQRGEARPVPTALSHELTKRDQGQCNFILPNGQRCPQTRWVQKHHIQPWARGGTHSLENLTTLCSTHHRYVHEHGLTRAKENYFRAGARAR